MDARKLLTEVGAGIAFFLLVAVLVIELLDFEFSAIIGLPIGYSQGLSCLSDCGAPRLSEGDPAGDYRIGDISLGFEAVDRIDVATCLLDRLEEHDYIEEMPKVGAV
ncbi:hypothetical protein DQW50_00890 [Halorubrum sp. 48-1-W]|uniref:hypothetical protein n=1 Tax=Halorubrum sp. 48-1-W TaxID=2249761 RepID=UPI000DCDD5A0|nr:hypothetical protein [Halorubrum sp. 48-1-W]RAW46975.1 hypothetical protein DQW50_00890 [Halorubrum sp. 48-1-W]